MSTNFNDAQRIVLRGTRWPCARHLMLHFGKANPLRFLNELLPSGSADGMLTSSSRPSPAIQCSLGFTRLGLKQAGVPDMVLSYFALKSPAYWAGAAQRAASQLALTGVNDPRCWDESFEPTQLHAVLSVHGRDGAELDRVADTLASRARGHGLEVFELPRAEALPPPDSAMPPGRDPSREQWVHFGYRDGLARIGIEGWSDQDAKDLKLSSWHKAGEFLLGQEADCGATCWVAGPGLHVWPDEVRGFFRNGSFGVLQQIEQHVAEFEAFVEHAAEILSRQSGDGAFTTDYVKALLCGRTPEGHPLVDPQAGPEADFDFTGDPKGLACPFGSHIRRMNPRVPRPGPGEPRLTEEQLAQYPAQFSQSRPLLRRGMPYGPPWQRGMPDDDSRGLIGQFFCASIEDQFEHLLGQWGDRVPMGSPDQGGARDPFMGAHEPGDGFFEIPRGTPLPALQLRGLTSFTRTRGASYLFYPSLTTLQGIADSSLWGLYDLGGDT